MHLCAMPWGLHLSRTLKSSEWTPRESKRLKGRPKKRWRDDIGRKYGASLMQIAQDRVGSMMWCGIHELLKILMIMLMMMATMRKTFQCKMYHK